MNQMTGDEALLNLLDQLDEDDQCCGDKETVVHEREEQLTNNGQTFHQVVSVEPEVNVDAVIAAAAAAVDNYNEFNSSSSSEFEDDTVNDPDFTISDFREGHSFNEGISSDEDVPSQTCDHTGHSTQISSSSDSSNATGQGGVRQHDAAAGVDYSIQQSTTPTRSTEKQPTKTRKRKRQPEKWKRTVLKKAHASGESYVNTKGNPMKEKSVGDDCKCRSKCFEKLGSEHISKLFKEFCDIGDTNKQDYFLFGKIRGCPIKRRRPRSENSESKKSTKFKYYVKSSTGDDVEFCRKAFMSIHSIGKTCFEKLRTKDPMFSKDQRGKHGNQKTISEATNDQIKTHIKSFPCRQSHYSRRKNPNKVYLSEDLNAHRMWTMYLKLYECDEYGKLKNGKKSDMNPKVKYSYYKHIFDTSFNIGFGSPRSDTCPKCDQLSQEIDALKVAGTENETEQKENELRLHQTKADNGYAFLTKKSKEAKENESIDVYTFDFQQNLPLPKLTTNDIFYSRQLWLYNFGIHDCKTGKGLMHVWHEALAGRGSSEVCSCLNKVLTENNRNTTHLFSDGCAGQNKNKAMVVFLQSLIERKVYQRIDHIFLYRGHTYLPNDRDFAQIEKRKKVTTRVELPSDYIKLIKESKHDQPFEVIEIDNKDVLNFKESAENCMPKTTLKDTNGTKLQFSDVHWFSYGKSDLVNETCTGSSVVEHNGEVWCRYSHNVMEQWKRVKIFKRQFDKVPFPGQKYDAPLKIKEAKYKDLIKLCDKGLISNTAANFYRNLEGAGPLVPRGSNESDEDDTDFLH